MRFGLAVTNVTATAATHSANPPTRIRGHTGRRTAVGRVGFTVPVTATSFACPAGQRRPHHASRPDDAEPPRSDDVRPPRLATLAGHAAQRRAVPNIDHGRVLAVPGAGSVGSPVGDGLMVLWTCVTDSARRHAGSAAFAVDAEGDQVLLDPWSTAASALLHAAMAIGAPDHVDDAADASDTYARLFPHFTAAGRGHTGREAPERNLADRRAGAPTAPAADPLLSVWLPGSGLPPAALASAPADRPSVPARRVPASGRLGCLRELLEEAFAEGRQVVR